MRAGSPSMCTGLPCGQGEACCWVGTSGEMAEPFERHLAGCRQVEEELRRVNRALKALSRCNQALIRARDEAALLQDVCRIIVEVAGYRLCWVGYAEETGTKTVRPIAQWGYEAGYLETLDISCADTERGRGPAGTAIRTGKPNMARHILTDPNFAPWRAEAIKRGYASSLALPLTSEDRTLGALNVYAREPDAFDAEEVQFLTELADDLVLGILTLRTRAAQKQAEQVRQALYQASLEIQTPRPIADRLKRLLQTAQELLLLDRIALFLADPEGRWLEMVVALGTDGPGGPLRAPIGPDLGGLAKAFQTRAAVVWDGGTPVPAELRLKPPYDQIKALRTRVFALVPLIVQGRAIGVLAADRRASRKPFDPVILELLQLFASQSAPAIEQAWLYEELRQYAFHLEAMVEDRTRALQAANTKLQEVVRELEAASRQKSEFLANMSHELRTPLNSIIGFSELLLGEGVGPLTEKQARFLGHIDQGGRHLLQLISDILDLSKVEAGKFTLQPETLPIAATLEDILVIARGLANKKAQEIRSDIAPDLPPLRADPVRFKQILFNLLSNAVKFTPAKGQIRLGARRAPAEGTFLELRVTDTGAGIRAEDLPRLFQEFVQLETTKAQHHEGTGLGLALTRQLVELHGGRIWAESAGVGQGSTFTALLPFGGPQAPQSAPMGGEQS